MAKLGNYWLHLFKPSQLLDDSNSPKTSLEKFSVFRMIILRDPCSCLMRVFNVTLCAVQAVFLIRSLCVKLKEKQQRKLTLYEMTNMVALNQKMNQ